MHQKLDFNSRSQSVPIKSEDRMYTVMVCVCVHARGYVRARVRACGGAIIRINPNVPRKRILCLLVIT